MEPQYSVLLYSKYSPNCKRLLGFMEQSGIDFTGQLRLQLLCIDNEKVRQRISKNVSIDITIVPCILTVYGNGGVEKFDGAFAFSWVEDIVSQLKPPPPQPVPQQREPQQREPQPDPEPPSEQRRESQHEPQREQYKPPEPQVQTNPSKVPQRMQRINREEPSTTSIEDIPFEKETEDDRHRNIPQPKRIRQGENQFIEDEELFAGEPLSIRREPQNSVRNDATSRKIQDPHGTEARAKDLARQRELDEQMLNKPSDRPTAPR